MAALFPLRIGTCTGRDGTLTEAQDLRSFMTSPDTASSPPSERCSDSAALRGLVGSYASDSRIAADAAPGRRQSVQRPAPTILIALPSRANPCHRVPRIQA